MSVESTISVRAVETNEEIHVSLRRVTCRKFEKAIGLLEEARDNKDLTREQKLGKRDEAFVLLVGKVGSKVLDECSFADVQKVLDSAIDANQIGPDEEKKSE
jgi:hypothetical protein